MLLLFPAQLLVFIEKISTFTSYIPCFLSFFVVVVVFDLWVVFIAPFAPSPLCYCYPPLLSRGSPKSHKPPGFNSIWASSPHFFSSCFIIYCKIDTYKKEVKTKPISIITFNLQFFLFFSFAAPTPAPTTPGIESHRRLSL